MGGHHRGLHSTAMPGVVRQQEVHDQQDGQPSPKRARADSGQQQQHQREDGPEHRPLTCPPPHAQPLGNLLLQAKPYNCRNPGLGRLAVLPDELLASIFSELHAVDLVRCQGASRAFFAFSRIEGHWKLEYIKRSRGSLEHWQGSWRSTYLHNYLRPSDYHSSHNGLPTDGIRIDNLYSDVLYLPHLAARYDSNDIASSSSFLSNIAKVDGRNLSAPDLGDSPMILQHLMDDWPAMAKWSLPALAAEYPSTLFRAEAVLTRMSDYTDYHDACSADESPLYIFDADFVEKTATATATGDADADALSEASSSARQGSMAETTRPARATAGTSTRTRNQPNRGRGMESDFTVPGVFRDDLFKVLEDERPNYRWLIAGPERSGSTFHCDPNGTSAWNAVVTGRKLWILFPPDVVPPGIMVSEDQSEVEAPLSLAEWLFNYYPQAKAMYGPRAKDPKLRNKLQESVCETGEIFYVPAGWWHLVVNLESSIAVTQNFVSPSNLAGVLYFFKHRGDQVSGFKLKSSLEGSNPINGSISIASATATATDTRNGELADYRGEEEDETGGGAVFARFVAALEERFPDLARQGLKELEEVERRKSAESARLSGVGNGNGNEGAGKGSLWSAVTARSTAAQVTENALLGGTNDVGSAGEVDATAGGGDCGFSFGFDLDGDDLDESM